MIKDFDGAKYNRGVLSGGKSSYSVLKKPGIRGEIIKKSLVNQAGDNWLWLSSSG
jgi:hypothetical protein